MSASLPLTVGHLAQNPASEGSGTSAGFGGPLVDWDPCRRHASTQQGVGNAQADAADPSTWQQAPIVSSGDTCEVRVDANGDTDFTDVNSNGERIDSANNGVSGTYIGTIHGTVVECMGWLDESPIPGVPDGTHDTCDPIRLTSGWDAVGTAACDVEFLDGMGVADEAWIDNGFQGGNVPDGTFDDGGIGGACHVATYSPGSPKNANTNGSDTNENNRKEFNTNNAHTQCRFDDEAEFGPEGNEWFVKETVSDDKGYTDESTLVGQTTFTHPHEGSDMTWSNETGTAYAEDWVLGADVPIVVACDSATTQSGGSVGAVIVCLAVLPPDVECAVDESEQILFPDPGTVVSCVPYEDDDLLDTTNLGKGGGHIGDGVTVPDELDPCPQGEIVVFTTALVSANPFGSVHGGEDDGSHNGVDEHVGWPGLDGDAQALSDWNSDAVVDGTGDTIVYLPVGGWIDHFYHLDTSPDAFGCGSHTDSHDHGPTGLTQDDHLGPLDTHSGPGDCGG